MEIFYNLIVLVITGYMGVISNSCQNSSNCTLERGACWLPLLTVCPVDVRFQQKKWRQQPHRDCFPAATFALRSDSGNTSICVCIFIPGGFASLLAPWLIKPLEEGIVCSHHFIVIMYNAFQRKNSMWYHYKPILHKKENKWDIQKLVTTRITYLIFTWTLSPTKHMN